MNDLVDRLIWSLTAAFMAAGSVVALLAVYAGPPLLLLLGGLWILDLFGLIQVFGGAR